jgi:tetraacyldisaccharide 4'-kinase
LLYGAFVFLRNILYDRGVLPSREHDIPVICVGNLAAGGTGKTIHVDYLVRLLKAEYRVAVLSRGYRRRSRGFRIVMADDTVSLAGDEPLQIAARHPDITIAVDRNRNHGIEQLLKLKPETGVIILDDGFQHRSLTPGRSIVLSEYSNLYTDDCLLPCGRLREHRYNIRRADIILITKTPPALNAMDRRIMFRNLGKFPYQNLYFTALKYGSPLPVFHGSAMTIENMETVRGNRVMLITGIANPLPLKEHLESLTAGVVHRAYPDHHNFTREDMANISRDRLFVGEGPFYIFTTEKDAVRLRMHTDLPEIIKGNLYFIPVEAEFLNDDALEFNNHIINYVRKNKGNRRIPG